MMISLFFSFTSQPDCTQRFGKAYYYVIRQLVKGLGVNNSTSYRPHRPISSGGRVVGG